MKHLTRIFILTLIAVALFVSAESFVSSFRDYPAAQQDDCDKPGSSHCAKESDTGHFQCLKCRMACDENGKKFDDPKCGSYCCVKKCDCYPCDRPE